jgi:hypothetical protein
LLLAIDHSAGRHVFSRRNFHILNQSVHHYDTAASDPRIKYRRAKADEAIIPDISRTVNQTHVGNGCIFPNPHRVVLLVIPDYPTFFKAMNHNAILNVATCTNVK